MLLTLDSLLHSAKYAGVFTVASYTMCPSILAIRSRQYVTKAGLPSTTRYRTVFSNDYVAYFLILVSLALIFGVFVDAMVGFSDNLLTDDDVTDDFQEVDSQEIFN